MGFRKGLYTEVFESIEALDERLNEYLNELANYNYEALAEIKKCFGKTLNIGRLLLYERAAISGRLVL